MPPEIVLFDLDGTLTDSATVILDALDAGFAAHGLEPLERAHARSLLGPPFYESLPPLVGDTTALSVIAAFREHYATTMLDAPLYDGMADLLRALAADGRRLAVASSKSEVYVRQIVDHHGLTDLFETVGGDELDGSLGTKARVVERVLARLGDPDPSRVVMVGDRLHDVVGAGEHGISCLGVRWGYAVPGELEDAGALAIHESPTTLGAALGLDAVG
ncbi:MAG: HAD hydrolase-like protein [Nocardioidaceae bacterium]|nr:HAD hydrolase-like protein [Nocardioidaceae bacterium]MCL2615080.1 HAD hydrolase-like protein [Nocardioidaceae bacterium]